MQKPIASGGEGLCPLDPGAAPDEEGREGIRKDERRSGTNHCMPCEDTWDYKSQPLRQNGCKNAEYRIVNISIPSEATISDHILLKIYDAFLSQMILLVLHTV